MAVFKYKALTADGENLSGVVEAFDEFEAVDRLRERGYVVSQIKQAQSGGESILTRDLMENAPFKEKSLALLCSQFAILLNAGLPVVRTVEIIADQTADKRLKKLLLEVAKDVAAGHALADSFEDKAKGRLPATFLETLRAGEESGSLEPSFRKLQSYYDNSWQVKSKVRSAMIYPIFLCVMSVAVIAIVLNVAMPVFMDMFQAAEAALPLPTQILMSISAFMSRWWYLILVGVIVLVLALRAWGKTEKGATWFARTQLSLPALGRVAEMKGASQFTNTMSAMLTAGLPMVRAVAVTARVLDNHYLARRLETAVGGLTEGRRLGDCLTDCGCFPELMVEMAAVGEESGSLEETLDTIGAYYTTEVAEASKKALSILQPAITVAMGIVIGFIVISLYLPMFTVYSYM